VRKTKKEGFWHAKALFEVKTRFPAFLPRETDRLPKDRFLIKKNSDQVKIGASH
jgi:hypothetical protein